MISHPSSADSSDAGKSKPHTGYSNALSEFFVTPSAQDGWKSIRRSLSAIAQIRVINFHRLRCAIIQASLIQESLVSYFAQWMDYSGQPATELALKLAPHLFVRPIELRKAHWAEFDLDDPSPTWRIPTTKMRKGHIVPLAFQVVPIWRELHVLTGQRVLCSRP
jgi:hypothetical protein